jgi:putative ATPase
LAELIATKTDSAFVRLSGVVSSVADIRSAVATAIKRREASNRSTILFIDEIHRFNKARQDVLLPYVENGNVRLIGATTLNPNFYIVGPLLSRSLVFRLEPLGMEDVSNLLKDALKRPEAFGDRFKVEIEPEALEFLAEASEGDARKALTALEIAVETTEPKDGIVRITRKIAEESIQKKALEYGADGHYDTASAFIKSMRGSDPDAAIYWLAKMLAAGEDVSFISRRLVIFAAEDVGNADPRALSVALDAMKAAEAIGMPEARIILAQAATYCATAPKSNASYAAINAALDDVENERVAPVPMAIRDAHYKGASKMGHGVGYAYPHDNENHFVAQEYLGTGKRYYMPTAFGFEAEIRKRIDFWNKLRAEAADSGGRKER